VQQCAHPVLKIFSYTFTSYSGLIIALQHTSIGFFFLRIDTLQDIPFMSKLFLSFSNDCGAIRLKRNDWREMKELNLQC